MTDEPTPGHRLHTLLHNGKDCWAHADSETHRYYELVSERFTEQLAAEVREQRRQAEKWHGRYLELAEAERYVREIGHEDGELRSHVDRVMAEYDRRGAEAEVRRLHTWDGLMSLLDAHYPPDVPLGPDSDPGPRILRLTRELDAIRRRVRAVCTGRRTVAAAAVLNTLRATDGDEA